MTTVTNTSKFNGDGTKTDTKTVRQSDGRGYSVAETYKPGLIFNDRVSISRTEFGPKKR